MLVKTTELQSSCITPLLLTEEIWHICRIYSLFFSGKFPVAKLKKSMCGQDLILPVGLTKAAWKPLQALHSGAWSSVLDQFHILLWEHTAAARENRSLKSYWSYMKKKKKKSHQKIGLQVVSVNIMRAALLPVGRWGNEAAIFLETNQKHCRK